MGECEYDVFVSYRHGGGDEEWVRSVLVPRLAEVGAKVMVDYQSFRLGRPVVKEMERGVESSKFTLAVLSPAYLDSGFTDLENVLAETVGLEQRQEDRLLAVMLEECTPRLGFRARLYLDLTTDRGPASLDRLVATIQEPRDC